MSFNTHGLDGYFSYLQENIEAAMSANRCEPGCIGHVVPGVKCPPGFNDGYADGDPDDKPKGGFEFL